MAADEYGTVARVRVFSGATLLGTDNITGTRRHLSARRTHSQRREIILTLCESAQFQKRESGSCALARSG